MHLLESYGLPLLGGALIGLSASLVLLFHGRIAGIAGLFGGLFLPGHDVRSLRLWFIVGLAGAGLVLLRLYPAAFSSTASPTLGVVVAGVLVGYGTRLGGGCTSGHGICGLCRLSVRSVVATMTFMGAGMVTVFVVKHLVGGGQ